MLLQVLNIIKQSGRSNFQHNSAEYVHFVAEAFKLVAEDRELYYGDPKFTDVPLDRLLSTAHARELLEKIEAGRARILDQFPGATDAETRNAVPGGRTFDTSYACVVDAEGNAISCTPSDGVLRNAPMIPGTGLIISARGLQSRVDPAHPSSVQPRKRPRLTPNPAMIVKDDEYVMPFGTPGADYQVQAMLQVLLNIQGFGMELQEAIEAPRFFSCSFPDSFSPHAYYPGVLQLESGFEQDVYVELANRGHKVQPWPESVWPQAGVCVVKRDVRTGLVSAGADCRKVSYAIVS